MKLNRLLYCLLAFGLVACHPEAPHPSTIIMEGWIDAEGHPVVLIHKTYALESVSGSSKTIEELAAEQLIPFGKVTVSDGTNEVVLTGRLDTAYIPPYTYSSLDMRGQVGKTYTFSAKYNDFNATARTTIPPVASLDSLTVNTANPENVVVIAYMAHIPPTEEAYYALFLRRYGEKQYQLCPFCVFDGQDAVDGKMEMRLYNPHGQASQIGTQTHHFHNDPSLSMQEKSFQLKVARIDNASYQFWKAYNERVVTSGILFVPIYKNIPSNVVGGYGIVSGMGSSFYLFNISNDTTYRY